jgi:uncharacterized protein
MERRRLGRTDLTPNIIGLGVEHLNGQPRETVQEVLAYALAAGIDFIDLIAWTPEVQECVGEAIRGRRESLILAGHLGMAETDGQYRRTRDIVEAQRCVEALMTRLGTDHLDILYCMHNSDQAADLDDLLAPGGFLEIGRRLQEQGVTRYLGFSGHTAANALRAIEAACPDVIMYPVNLHATAAAENVALLERCEAEGVGVVAMKALAGGTLLERCPTLSPAECLTFTLAQPGVATVAVGCRTVAHVDAALAYLSGSDELRSLPQILDVVREALRGQCTYCNHCQPCPVEIDIAAVHRLLAQSESEVTDELRGEYQRLAVPASACIRCEVCVERCPFGVESAANMARAAEAFEQGGTAR